MSIGITHSTVATLPDQPGVEINKAQWNDAHVLSGLGTGVETALGINVGSAGAVIVNGGALGTPSSGNLANCTGYPASTPAYPVTVTGGVSGGIPYFNSTTQESSSALLAANGVVVGGGGGAAPATNANLVFNATGSVSGGPSLTIGSGSGTSSGWVAGYGNVLSLGQGSTLHLTGITASTSNYTLYADQTSYTYLNAISSIRFAIGNSVQALINNSGGFAITNAGSTAVSYISTAQGTPNAVVFNNANVATSSATPATSRTEINKLATGIANNTATATLTVTIPNGNHSAGGRITLKGAAGAGGAIGADEFSALIEYDFVVTRTTGVNAVATLSAALLTAITASVAGATTPTISAALSAISGAVGATNTFTFNVTINALTGSSTNHTCFCYATLINDNASGVTIA